MNTRHRNALETGFGISAISTLRPECELPNAWYEETLPRKFVKHTGIETRGVSFEDEVSMATRCVQDMVAELPYQLNDCAGVVFVSPSFVPLAVANRYWGRERAREEQLSRATERFVQSLEIEPRRAIGINGFCSGYARAMSLVKSKLLPSIALSATEFVLVVTSSRISRITDYECTQSGALFGDFATATVLSRCDSHKYPVTFEVLDGSFKKQQVSRPMFDFSMKENVAVPTPDGGRDHDPQRLVFSLDGMGIAEVAPRAMAASAAEMLQQNGLSPDEIQHVVPHQAGDGIVRFTSMKLEQEGVEANVVNGMTKEIGNVSSGSVPFALKNYWDELSGYILCPVAAVGAPGKCEVSEGCVLLRRTPNERAAAA